VTTKEETGTKRKFSWKRWQIFILTLWMIFALVRLLPLFPEVKFTAGFLWLLLVPGLAVRLRFRRAGAPVSPEILAEGFALSLAIATVLHLFCRIFAAPVAVLAYGLPFAGLLIGALPMFSRQEQDRADPGFPSVREALFRSAGWFLPLALIASAGFFAGAAVTQPGDTWHHLAMVRRIAETGTVDVPNPFLAERFAHPYPQCWHALLAVLTESAGIGRLAAWELLPGLLYPLLLLSIFGLALALTGSRTAAALAAFLMPFCQYGGVSVPSTMASFPAVPAAILLWVSLRFAYDSLTGRNRRGLLPAVFLMGACSVFHAMEPFLFLVALFSFGLFLALGRRMDRTRLRRFVLTATLTLCLSLPYPMFMLRAHFQERVNNPAGTTISLTTGLKKLPGGLFVVDPGSGFFDKKSLPVFLSFFLALFLLRKLRSEDAAAYLAGNTFFPLLFLFFPPLITFLMKLGFPADFLYRFDYLIPYPIVLAVFLDAWKKILRDFDAPKSRRALTNAAMLLTLVVIFGTPYIRPETFWNLSSRRDLTRLEESSLFEVVRAIPSGSVTATDMATADLIPEISGGRVVCGISWHVNSTRHQVEVRDLFRNPYLSSHETTEILRRLKADYFLLNLQPPEGFDWKGYRDGFYSDGDTLRFFLSNPGHFSLVKRAGEVCLFARNRGDTDGPFSGKDAPRVFSKRYECGNRQARAMNGFGDLTLLQASCNTPRTGPGRRLALSLCWQALDETRDAPLVGVFLVPADFRNRESGAPARLRRVFAERLSGKSSLFYFSFRPWRWFRIDNRFFLEVTLHPGERVSHEAGAHLPNNLAPGLYEIWIGPDAAVPPFPKPVGPVLGETFKKIGDAAISD
jgi:hypothetical protein